jgi:hypothetical protein
MSSEVLGITAPFHARARRDGVAKRVDGRSCDALRMNLRSQGEGKRIMDLGSIRPWLSTYRGKGGRHV